MNGLADICNPYLGGIRLASGRTSNDNPDVLAVAVGDHCCFDSDLINRINYNIKAAVDNFVEIFLGNKFLDALDYTIRVYLTDPLGHCINLGFTINISKGVDLSIGVGFRNHIKVDRSNSPYPCSGQSLHCPRSNAADADNANVCCLKTRRTLFAI